MPRSHYFHGRLYRTSKYPVSGGGSAEVWRVEDDRKRVYAAKAFRVTTGGEEYKVKVCPGAVKRIQTTYPYRRDTSKR